MNPGNTISFARFTTPLAAGGVNISAALQVGTDVLQMQFSGLGLIKGFLNSDVDGVLDIYQGFSLADITLVQFLPTGTSDAALLLQTTAFVSIGALSPGIPFTMAIVAPFVAIRYTNGVAPQTFFRLSAEVTE